MIYKFDKFEVDTKKFELRSDGLPQNVGNQVFDLIHLLVKNRQRVVQKEEIIDAIWGGRIVSETTISSCVKSARKLLGDDGESQKFIKTTRGRGLQFVHKIDKIIEDEKENSDNSFPLGSYKKKIFVLVTALICLILLVLNIFPMYQQEDTGANVEDKIANSGIPNSIAVMPFTDMSEEGNQAFFGDGIAEEILNELNSVNDLNVKSRTTSFSLRNQNLSVPEISDRLNVKYIVEGSVRSSGNRIRITAQLIDAENDLHLWSNTYDRELNDIFEIQDEISIAISQALNTEISSTITSKDVPTENMQAYALYLQGHQLFMDRGTRNSPNEGEQLEQAILFLKSAVDLDPHFAEAWADLASANIVLPTYYARKYSPTSVISNALEAANRAISQDANLSQAWAAKGFIELSLFNFQDADVALRRAVELNPKNETAWLWLSLHYASVGYHSDAIDAVQNAINLSPNVAINYGVLSTILHAQGSIDEAVMVLDQAIEERDYEAGRIDRALIAIWNNNEQRAIHEFDALSVKYGEPLAGKIRTELEIYMKAYRNPEYFNDAIKLVTKNIEDNATYTFYGIYLLQDAPLMINFLKTEQSNNSFNLRRLYNPLARELFKNKAFREYIIDIGLYRYWTDNKFPDFCGPTEPGDFMCPG